MGSVRWERSVEDAYRRPGQRRRRTATSSGLRPRAHDINETFDDPVLSLEGGQRPLVRISMGVDRNVDKAGDQSRWVNVETVSLQVHTRFDNTIENLEW